MPMFTDAKNREWLINLNLGTMKKVKEKTGFDFLANDADSNPLLRLASDYMLLADVVWQIVEDDATKKNISVEDFVGSLVGDPLDRLVDALAEAYVLFTPSPQRREVLSRLWAKVRQHEAQVLAQAAAQVESTNLDQQTTGV